MITYSEVFNNSDVCTMDLSSRGVSGTFKFVDNSMCHVITLGVFQKFFLDDVNFYSVCIITFVNMTNLMLIWLVLNFSYFNHILLNFSMVEADGRGRGRCYAGFAF